MVDLAHPGSSLYSSFLFCHLFGNVLLVYEYLSTYPSTTSTVWRYILKSIRLSFLVTAALAFLSRVRTSLLADDEEKKKLGITMKLLNLVNLSALICLITRYSRTKCTNCQAEMFNPSLPVQTKVAAVVYIALLLTIFLLAVVGLEGV